MDQVWSIFLYHMCTVDTSVSLGATMVLDSLVDKKNEQLCRLNILLVVWSVLKYFTNTLVFIYLLFIYYVLNLLHGNLCVLPLLTLYLPASFCYFSDTNPYIYHSPLTNAF